MIIALQGPLPSLARIHTQTMICDIFRAIVTSKRYWQETNAFEVASIVLYYPLFTLLQEHWVALMLDLFLSISAVRCHCHSDADCSFGCRPRKSGVGCLLETSLMPSASSSYQCHLTPSAANTQQSLALPLIMMGLAFFFIFYFCFLICISHGTNNTFKLGDHLKEWLQTL